LLTATGAKLKRESSSAVEVLGRDHIGHARHIKTIGNRERFDGSDHATKAEKESSDDRHEFVASSAEPLALWRSWRAWRSLYCLGLLVADSAAAALALGFCYLVRPAAERSSIDVLDWRVDYKVLGVLTLGVWLVALMFAGSYRAQCPGEGLREYRVPVVTALRLMALVAIASFAIHAAVSRVLVVVFFPSLVVTCLFTRWLLRQVVSRLRRKGYALNRVILAGDEGSIKKFAEHLFRDRRHGYQVVGVCVPGGYGLERQEFRTLHGAYPILGSPSGLVDAARRLSVDSVAVVGTPRFEDASLQQVAWQLERINVDLLVAPDVVDLAGPRIKINPVTGLPLLHITEPRIRGAGSWLKPCYERVLAVPLLVLASPLLLAVALAIVVDSGRPVFYRQRRIGFRGEEFEMLKFRTMVQGAEAMLPDLLAANEHDGPLFKIRKDPRVTRVGRLFRKCSLDELPQLFNVVRGQMVLVGPRPCLPQETEGFGEAAKRRFLARPGLTGLWQVNGRSDINWDEAVRLDLYYVENWSPFLDLTILYRTMRVVIGGRGGY
jgi:exopolysaccharide biosynthesis polyprenyl glycosylphosphotransferase